MDPVATNVDATLGWSALAVAPGLSSFTIVTLACRQRSRAAGVMTAVRNTRSVAMPSIFPSNVETLTTSSAIAISLLTTLALVFVDERARSPASNVLNTLRTMDSISAGFTFMDSTKLCLRFERLAVQKT